MHRVEAEVQLQDSRETDHCHHGDEHGKVHPLMSFSLNLLDLYLGSNLMMKKWLQLLSN